jgi:polar amino acid transport system substrate-binding protein
MKRSRGFWVSVFVGMVAAAMMLAPSRAGAASTLERIVEAKTFNIGVIPGLSTIADPSGTEFSGYGPDAMKSICEQMDVKCAFQQTTWSTFAAGLQSGKFDLSIAETFTTVKRAMAVAFTRPVFYLGTGAVTLKSSKIRTLDDMNKPSVSISVGQGTSQQDWVQKNLPKANLVVTKALTEVRLLDLLSKKADVAFADSGQSARFAAQYPQVLDLFATQPLEMMAVAWAVRPGDQEMLNFMDVCIRNLQSTGKLGALMRQYKVPPGSFLIPVESAAAWK